MREIAYTSFGGNALAAGLICHFAAIHESGERRGCMKNKRSDVM
jgi:hypothetical protein